MNHLLPPERKTAILMEGSIPCEIIRNGHPIGISQAVELKFTQAKYTSPGSAGVDLPALVDFTFNLYSGYYEISSWLEFWRAM